MKTMTTAEICRHLGVDRVTLHRAIKDGCPVAKRGRGGKWSRFNPGRVAAWFLAHGKNPKGIEGAKIREAMSGQPDQPQPPLAATEHLVNKLGLLGCLERVRQQERALHGSLVQAVKNNATPGEIGAINRIITAKAAELRQLEMSALEYQRKIGELCNYSEMERVFVELASGTRERVMGVANNLVPVLRGFLRDPDDAGKVRDAIDSALRHALTALPQTLPQGGK